MDAKVAGVEVESVEYYQGSGTVRSQFDQEKTPPSMAVIATLADVMGVDPVELDPLYSTIDPEALDSLVRVRNRTSGDIRVSFTHENHAITVHSYGLVTIAPKRGPAAKTHNNEMGR